MYGLGPYCGYPLGGFGGFYPGLGGYPFGFGGFGGFGGYPLGFGLGVSPSYYPYLYANGWGRRRLW